MGTKRKGALSVVTIGLLLAVSQLLTDCRRQDGQRPQVREIGNEAMQDHHIMQRARAMLLTISREVEP